MTLPNVFFSLLTEAQRVAASFQWDEATTRERLIDEMLIAANWNLASDEVKKNSRFPTSLRHQAKDMPIMCYGMITENRSQSLKPKKPRSIRSKKKSFMYSNWRCKRL